MANSFDQIFARYKKYMDTFFTGEDLLTRDEVSMFRRAEGDIERRGKTMEERALENLQRRGVMASGIGDQFISENVTRPIAEAYASLDFQRASIEQQRLKERRDEALRMAIQQYQEKKARESGIFSTIGRIGGTVLGGLAGTFLLPGVGTAAGAALGSQLFGGGGGDFLNDPEVLNMLNYLNSGGEPDFNAFNGGGRSPLRGTNIDTTSDIRQFDSVFDIYGNERRLRGR